MPVKESRIRQRKPSDRNADLAAVKEKEIEVKERESFRSDANLTESQPTPHTARVQPVLAQSLAEAPQERAWPQLKSWRVSANWAPYG